MQWHTADVSELLTRAYNDLKVCYCKQKQQMMLHNHCLRLFFTLISRKKYKHTWHMLDWIVVGELHSCPHIFISQMFKYASQHIFRILNQNHTRQHPYSHQLHTNPPAECLIQEITLPLQLLVQSLISLWTQSETDIEWSLTYALPPLWVQLDDKSGVKLKWTSTWSSIY